MGYYLSSISDEYDKHGNYIGNSAEGNKFHNVNPSIQVIQICSACGSSERIDHICSGTVCAACDCGESQLRYR